MRSIAFILLLMLVAAASAANVAWEDLQATVLDKQVMVRDTDGVSTRATVRGINDREIILVRGNGEALTIPREKVNRVQLWSRGTGALKGLLWGAAIGAGIFGLGSRAVYSEGTAEEAAAFFAAGTAMSAGIGGGLGAAAGGVSTVYMAPKPADLKAKRGFAPPIQQAGTQRAFGPQGPRPLSGSARELGTPETAALPAYLAAAAEER